MERVLTERFDQALLYARQLHATQTRKGTTIPYFSHLMAVSGLVLEHANPSAPDYEDFAIAALLHDAAEDCGGRPRLAEIRTRFGATVAAIVEACSDSLTEGADSKAPWPLRKREYLAHLREAKDPGYLLVTAADKLHNARTILTDLATHGPAVWLRFIGEDPRRAEKTAPQIVGYYALIAEALEHKQGRHSALVRQLAAAVRQIEADAKVTADTRWEARH